MNEKKQKNFCILIGCLIGLVFILLIFSPKNVIPTNTAWVENGGGDNLQHYLGWRFFRNSSWNRYLLFMRNLNYPIGTSVIVTDSNPLFSLIFKLFRNFLPDEFQFNGIWLVTSFVLLGFFAAEIGWKLTQSLPLTLAGVVMALLNPVILQRALIHDTLTAHWLILAGIWLFLNDEKKWNLPGWFLLTNLTLLIHIYFIPMLAFLVLLQMIRMACKQRAWYRVLSVFVVFAAALGIGYFAFGYAHILPQSGSYGELSMNLNAFFNPDSIPALLGARPRISLQYEGFNYYGLGMLILILSGVLMGGKRLLKQVIPYLLPILGLVLLAVSNIAYFDQNLVYQFDLPEKLYETLSIFRSSGRLVWPLYYLGLFGVLCAYGKPAENNGKRKYQELVLFLCVLIQVLDLNQFHRQTAERFRNPTNVLPELQVEFVNLIPENSSHLYCSDGESKMLDRMALFAADRKMSFNISANARGIEPVYGGDPVEMKNLSCDQLQPDSVYVFLNVDSYPASLDMCGGASVTEVNEWHVVIPGN